MNNKENLQAFKNLIKRYESITLEEIQEAFEKEDGIHTPPNYLTGFGTASTCSLCQTAHNTHCVDCVWGVWSKHTSGDCQTGSPCYSKNTNNMQIHSTYYTIKYAHTPKKLLEAFKQRARVMTQVLKELGY